MKWGGIAFLSIQPVEMIGAVRMYRRVLWMVWAALAILMIVAMGGNAQTASPSGSGKIVFVSSSDSHKLQVYLMNVDGSNPIQLTTSPGMNSCPAFSPDGRKIVFRSNREGNVEPYNEKGFQTYVMNVDGSSVTRLTNPPAEHGCASFSPDGRRIVFTAGSSGGMGMDFALYAMNSDGSSITRLAGPPVYPASPPRFSPDGRKVLFASFRSGLSTVDPDGSNVVPLKVPRSCVEADFSPDGGKIVAACDSPDKVQIYLMNSDGTNTVQLTKLPFGASSPAFSRDGRRIAFSAQPDPQKGVQIFIMNADGSGTTSLTSPSVFSFDPTFSP